MWLCVYISQDKFVFDNHTINDCYREMGSVESLLLINFILFLFLSRSFDRLGYCSLELDYSQF